jgi:hypothetical protein
MPKPNWPRGRMSATTKKLHCFGVLLGTGFAGEIALEQRRNEN